MRLGKHHITKALNSANICQHMNLSEHLTGQAALNDRPMCLGYYILILRVIFKALNIKHVSCLSQIVLCISPAAALCDVHRCFSDALL